MCLCISLFAILYVSSDTLDIVMYLSTKYGKQRFRVINPSQIVTTNKRILIKLIPRFINNKNNLPSLTIPVHARDELYDVFKI